MIALRQAREWRSERSGWGRLVMRGSQGGLVDVVVGREEEEEGEGEEEGDQISERRAVMRRGGWRRQREAMGVGRVCTMMRFWPGEAGVEAVMGRLWDSPCWDRPAWGRADAGLMSWA